MTNSEVRKQIEQLIAQTEATLARGKEMEARFEAFYQRKGIQSGIGLQRLLEGCARPEHKALTIRLLLEWAALPKRARELIERQEAKALRPTNVSVIRSRYRI
jgi:hypothetical protein